MNLSRWWGFVVLAALVACGDDAGGTGGAGGEGEGGSATTSSVSTVTVSTGGEEGAPFPEGVTEWSGTYACAQGQTNLDLTITRDAPQELSAVFAFSAHPDNPDVPTGSFRMIGTFDPATSAVFLEGTTWIDQPPGYSTVSLSGGLDLAQTTIAGDVLPPPGGACTVFSVSRQ